MSDRRAAPPPSSAQPWLRHWWPALAWAAVIWLFSSDLFAADHTGGLLLAFLRWLYPDVSLATYEVIHFLMRKGAHFASYFVLSLLVLRGIRGGRAGWRLPWALAALSIAAAYAVVDEIHQAFVPARTASAFDVLIDVSGAAAAQLIAWWFAGRGERALSRAPGEAETAP